MSKSDKKLIEMENLLKEKITDKSVQDEILRNISKRREFLTPIFKTAAVRCFMIIFYIIEKFALDLRICTIQPQGC